MKSHRSTWRLPIFGMLLLAATLVFWQLSTAHGESAPVDSAALAQNAAQALIENGATLSYRTATDRVSFARFAADGLATTGADAAARSQSFFNAYGAAFGISDASSQLSAGDTAVDGMGSSHVRYAQLHNGVPVFGSYLRTHFDADGNLVAANAAIVPNIKVNTVPTIDSAEAQTLARNAVATQMGADAATLNAAATLIVFRVGFVQNVAGPNHLAYEIDVTNGSDVHEFMYIDAHTGATLDQITGIETIEREISETTLANVIWDEGNGDPDPLPGGWAGGSAAQILDWQNEMDGAKETYNTIGGLTNGGYLSWDGADAIMRTVNNDPGISCPNANWNGVSTNYCTGVNGDDTVAHEWGHAYTDGTHNLVYQWQPGALNESYSDIWGEIVDLINGRGSDDAPGAMRTTNSCSSLGNGNPPNDNIYRWLSGEDDPAFGGAIRDMWKPECYNDPGTVSSNRYVCSTTDGGGVHTNSGVPNHAFALITDGGTFGGQTITGLGLTKAAHIYWRAQSVYQDKVSNFPDHADALEASCTDLIGIDLYGLDSSTAVGTLSGEMITAADCTEVEQTMLAVKMRNEPTQCNFGTYLLDPNSPALCGAGEAPVDLLNTNWDDGQLNGWTVGRHSIANPGSPSVNPDWVITSALPASEPGQAMFIFDSVNLGACTATDTVAGVYYLESPAFVIPGGVNNSELAFDHFVLTELLWDGGNVKVSVNSGAWQLIPTGNFTFNAYNASMNTVGAGNDNPLAGETGFTGSNPGTGGDVWGQSQVNLSGLVSPGDSVQIRFEMGLDGCNGVDGWYVDEVEAFYCDVSTAVTMSEVEATSDTASASPALLLTVSAMLATAGLIVFNHKRKDSLVD